MTVPDWYELWISSGTDETYSEWQDRQLYGPVQPTPQEYTVREREETLNRLAGVPPESVCSVCGVQAKDHTNFKAHNFVPR